MPSESVEVALQPPEPIAESAVRLRIAPENWPADLDPEKHYSAGAAYRAMNEARNVFEAFQAAWAAHAADRNLSPAGVHEANVKWAEANLIGLQKKLDHLRKDAAGFEESRAKAVAEELGPPPTEPADVALLAEIRTWLRSLPEADRTRKVVELAQSGDRAALRAVLTAPTYLTGVDEGLVKTIRDDVFRRAKPERDALHQDYRKALVAAERAVEGVARYIRQETLPAKLQQIVADKARTGSANKASALLKAEPHQSSQAA